ncbi:hypothetical protein DH09_04475 [Bacillaceae bacterium JMAK1]|nr:hypothetical protein DH09_04475 [Bacillaceae bacterium JMAK1]
MTKNENPRYVAAKTLQAVFFKGAYSHLALDEQLKNHDLTAVDQRFVTEVVYGTIKRLNTIDHLLNSVMKNKIHKSDQRIQVILRMAVYQMYYLDRIPERAAIHEAVELSKQWGRVGLKGLINGVLRALSRQGFPDFSSITPSSKRIALETSHPEWLVKRWINAYGEEETMRLCVSNSERGKTTIRVNQRVTSVDSVQKELEEEGIETVKGELASESLIVTKGVVTKSAPFKEGRLSIQDESSMLVARALNPQPSMKVLDACAAPGGKTMHSAELMNNEGEIIANDIHPHKKRLIEKEANRLQLSIVRATTEDAINLATTYQDVRFDRILVDAPCSGLGVLRSKPDIKWNTDEKEIRNLPALQLDILNTASKLLKDDGVLVYSTCTILPEENEHVVHEFLKNNEDFTQDESLQERIKIQSENQGYTTILPHQYGSDGFFICAMKKGSARHGNEN